MMIFYLKSFIFIIITVLVNCRPLDEIINLSKDPTMKIQAGWENDPKRDEKTEMDMIFPHNNRKRRASLANQNYKWDNAMLPYIFDRTMQPISSTAEIEIKRAMTHIQERTCVRFVARTNEANYVNFTRGAGCSSFVGKTRRRGQEINIADACAEFNVIVHEILHALGFLHEHTRLDRGQYVVINATNIQQNREDQFNIYTTTIQHTVTTHGLPYDRLSVLHYSRFTFSKHVDPRTNRIPSIRREFMTIYSTAGYREQLGSRTGLSATDVQRINIHYNCPAATTTTQSTTTTESITTTTVMGESSSTRVESINTLTNAQSTTESTFTTQSTPTTESMRTPQITDAQSTTESTFTTQSTPTTESMRTPQITNAQSTTESTFTTQSTPTTESMRTPQITNAQSTTESTFTTQSTPTTESMRTPQITNAQSTTESTFTTQSTPTTESMRTPQVADSSSTSSMSRTSERAQTTDTPATMPATSQSESMLNVTGTPDPNSAAVRRITPTLCISMLIISMYFLG